MIKIQNTCYNRILKDRLKPMSYRKLGKKYGLSYERIRQIIKYVAPELTGQIIPFEHKGNHHEANLKIKALVKEDRKKSKVKEAKNTKKKGRDSRSSGSQLS